MKDLDSLNKVQEALTKAFVEAFKKFQEEGGNIKDIWWFKPEKEKLELLKLKEYQCPDEVSV